MRQPALAHLRMARLSVLRYDCAVQPRRVSNCPGSGAGRVPGGKELPVSARQQSLNERCARFRTVISRPELEALTKRQRQLAELKIAELSLHPSGRVSESAANGSGRLSRYADAGVSSFLIGGRVRNGETVQAALTNTRRNAISARRMQSSTSLR
jgi:hypothetical protein